MIKHGMSGNNKAQAQHAKVTLKLIELTGGMGWRYMSGMHQCAIAGRNAEIIRDLLQDAYGIQANVAMGRLVVSAKESSNILAQTTKFPDLTSFVEGANAFAQSRTVEQAIPEHAPIVEPTALSPAELLDKLNHYTRKAKTTWSAVTDGNSPYPGMLQSAPTQHRAAIEQQKTLATIGLKTELVDQHSKYFLVVSPEAAETFVQKKLAKQQAREQGSHADQAALGDKGGIAR